MSGMRLVIVYLTVLILLSLSVGAGLVASGWPHWCHAARWCAPDWPAGAPADH
jgi:hypothetical protein